MAAASRRGAAAWRRRQARQGGDAGNGPPRRAKHHAHRGPGVSRPAARPGFLNPSLEMPNIAGTRKRAAVRHFSKVGQAGDCPPAPRRPSAPSPALWQSRRPLAGWTPRFAVWRTSLGAQSRACSRGTRTRARGARLAPLGLRGADSRRGAPHSPHSTCLPCASLPDMLPSARRLRLGILGLHGLTESTKWSPALWGGGAARQT